LGFSIRSQDLAESFAERVLSSSVGQFDFDTVKLSPKSAEFDISLLQKGVEIGVCQVKSTPDETQMGFLQAQQKYALVEVPLVDHCGEWIVHIKQTTQLKAVVDKIPTFVLLLHSQGWNQWPRNNFLSEIDRLVSSIATSLGIVSAFSSGSGARSVAHIVPESRFDSWAPNSLFLNDWLNNIFEKHDKSFKTIKGLKDRQRHLFIASGSGMPLQAIMEPAINLTLVPNDLPEIPDWLDYLWIGLTHLSNHDKSDIFFFDRSNGWTRRKLLHTNS